ncbi:hypothetical protein THAOC_08906, partial [Thalassiosira oceanica]
MAQDLVNLVETLKLNRVARRTPNLENAVPLLFKRASPHCTAGTETGRVPVMFPSAGVVQALALTKISGERIMASPSDDRPSTADDASLLSPDDLCGRSLLALVAAGHAMAARIRTLSDRVPLPYWAASRLPGP